MPKVVAIVQARMGSTRLPGKVLKPLYPTTVLDWVTSRCRDAPGVDEVYVATSVLAADDVIAEYCVKNRIPVWRGPEDDVLSRFVGAAINSQADVILRITGDCPFVDSDVIGQIIRLHKRTGAPFVTNVSPRTYPDGLDVQLMTREALLVADKEAVRPIDRDGVCTWIERNRARFPAETLICPIPGLEKERWVLDTAQDYEFCSQLAARLPGFGPYRSSMLDILDTLDKYPELRKINADHVMNERYFDALAEEHLYERTYRKSQEYLERAQHLIPLGSQTFSKSHLQYPQPSPIAVTHGQGALVWDADGNEYVDMVSALLPNVLGYRDPDVDAAIRRQLSSGISFSLATEGEAQLAEILCRLIPCAEGVRFGKTGTDATSAAVRLSRAYTGRDRVLVCGGYHGWADWSVEKNLGVPREVQKYTTRIPYGWNPANQAPLKFAAVIVDANSTREYLQLLRDYCDREGAVLIFDEIITGFRFGLGGAQELFGVTPDLACFGKAMANGMPLSAIVGRKEIMRKMAPPDNIFYSGTFFGETLSIAAAIATIKKLESEDLIPQMWATGTRLNMGLKDLLEMYCLTDLIRLSGKPPYTRLLIDDSNIAALLRKEMAKTGVLITNSHNITTAHGPNEVKRVLKSYQHSLSEISAALKTSSVQRRLAGATVSPGVR